MRRETEKYYFSVEGETEKWYLEWLQRKINDDARASCNVKFDCKVETNPLKRAKGLSVITETEIAHLMDRESEEEVHVERFERALARMKEAARLKTVKYVLGYSNFTFELWIVLHRRDCFAPLTHRGQYLAHINRAFGENFENLDHYKRETDFKRVLGKLTLGDVRDAVRRAESLMARHCDNGCIVRNCKGYKFYAENPSLSVGQVVKTILGKCDLFFAE